MNSLAAPPLPSRDSTESAQHNLQQLVDLAAMLVWSSDVHGALSYLSPGLHSLSDPPQRLAAGAWERFIYPADLPRVVARFKRAAAQRRAYQVEYRAVCSDGSVRWMLCSTAPRHSAQGEFAGFDGTVIDVSERHDRRDRLARSEAVHRLLTDHSSDLISHHGTDGTYRFVSPSVRQVQGFEPAELLGQNLFDFIHPEDAARVRDGLLGLGPQGAGAPLEFRKRHKDGRYIWLGTKAQPLADPLTGVVTGLVAVSRDISAERDMRDALKKREEQFRSLTTLSSDWYWETDAEDKFTFLSDGMAATLGVDPGELLGKSRAQLVAEPHDPSYRSYAASVARREPFKALHFSGQRSNMAPYHTRMAGEPVFADGVFQGYRGIATDITEAIGRTERLARLAEENRVVIENSLDLNVVCDAAGSILRANAAAAIVGYSPQELVGKQFTSFLVPDEIAATQQLIRAARSSLEPVQDHETRWVCKEGDLVFLSWSARWSADRSRVYCTARDVTERNRTRSALQRSIANLNAVLDSIGDAFFTVDRSWRITYANQIIADFVGRPRDKLVGRSLWVAVPEILASSFLAYFRTAMETGEPASFEGYFEPKRAWVEVRVYPHEEGLSIFSHDVTARRQAANALWLSEQRFREVVEMNPAGYFLTDARGALVEVNPALAEICGYDKAHLLGQTMDQLFRCSTLSAAVLAADGVTVIQGLESTIRHQRGHLVYVLINANIQRDGADNVLSVTAFLTDISLRKRVELDLKKQATHDGLTGLPNRVYLDEQLPEILRYAARDQVNAVLMLDLDGFKHVNDTLGHASGDLLLQEIAERLRQHTREGDIVARLGGDEFVVIAQCSTEPQAAAAIAEQLVAALCRPIRLGGSDVVVGASIGISLSPRDGSTKDELLQRADEAMYRAKAGGRNRYCFYDPTQASCADPGP